MATIQFKRGPLGRWSEQDPVLAVGEPGYVTDNGRIKIGDGKTPWNDLKYTDSDSYEVYPDSTSLPKVGEVGIVYFVIEDRSIRIYKDNDYFAFCSSTAEIGDLRKEVTDLTDNVEKINTKIVTLESAHEQITVNKGNISSILEEIHGIKNDIKSTNDSRVCLCR